MDKKNNKEKRLTVRLTDKQHKDLMDIAEELGMKPGEAMRFLVASAKDDRNV